MVQARLEKETAAKSGKKKTKVELAEAALGGFKHAGRKKPLPGFITRDSTSSFVPGSIAWNKLR